MIRRIRYKRSFSSRKKDAAGAYVKKAVTGLSWENCTKQFFSKYPGIAIPCCSGLYYVATSLNSHIRCCHINVRKIEDIGKTIRK